LKKVCERKKTPLPKIQKKDRGGWGGKTNMGRKELPSGRQGIDIRVFGSTFPAKAGATRKKTSYEMTVC